MFDMDKILAKWLVKNTGKNDYFKLSQDEKVAYDSMAEALKEHTLTDEDVYLFFNKVLNESEDKLIDPDISDQARVFYTVYLRLAKNIIRFLDAPKLKARNARMMLDNQLSKK